MLQALQVRPLVDGDADVALKLYNELTFGPDCSDANAVRAVLSHSGTTVLGALDGTNLCAMLTLHLMPNVTWGARPYGLIENVVTSERYRKRGIGKHLMQAALARAWAADAYKVMLMTGQKRDAKQFYEKAGFSSEDKHAMVARRYP